MIEYRPPTLRRQATIAGHGHLRYKRIAGDRKIGQRPDHGVAVPAIMAESGHRGSRVTGAQKMVVAFSSTAASVIVTPNSMVRMIVSATTDGGQAVASGKGHLGGIDDARV